MFTVAWHAAKGLARREGSPDGQLSSPSTGSFADKVDAYLAPARGATTFRSLLSVTCSGTPCGYQRQQHTLREHSQAMVTRGFFIAKVTFKLYTVKRRRVASI